MAKFQLYHTAMKIELPWNVSYSQKTGKAVVRKKELENLVYTFWPNGAPCNLVNVWLQSIASRSTGNSAETFAMHISHYIRYCYEYNTPLLALDDHFLCEFAKHLSKEKKIKNATLFNARSANHIIYTVRRVLDFLIWYQSNYRLASQPKLIGELGTGASVIIEWRKDRRGHPVLCHPAIPTTRPPMEDKQPMPDDFIGKLTDTITALKDKPFYPFGNATGPKQQELLAKNEYLYSRRMITIKLARLTGLRPAELNTIPLHLNLNPVETRRLYISTLKTREKTPPIRELPLTLEDALELSFYLQDRTSFLECIKSANRNTGSFLLSQNGAPIETRSLARDFKRICKLSGLSNVKVCLSMFRHRFITTQIAYEIKKELKRDIAQKDLWQEAVQRKILSRVAILTGHKDPMSLQTYFNDSFATAIANSISRFPRDTDAALKSLETSLTELEKLAAVHLDPNLARQIAQIEKCLIELKSAVSSNRS